MARQVELEAVVSLDDRASKGIQKFGKTVGKVGSTMTKAFTLPILGAGAAAIKFASDAEETQAKFDTVFGKMAKSTNAWAENFSEDVGRATTDVKLWMSTLQDTFVPLGFTRRRSAEFSKELAQLTVDLSSFNNVAEADVLRDLQSAIVGNHETVRKYGVIISETTLKQTAFKEGIGDLTMENGKLQGELSEQEKVLTRLKIITDGTTDAQGDAKRTAGSFANQMRRLKSQAKDLAEEFGKELLPIAKDLLKTFSGYAESFKNMTKEQKQFVIKVAGVVAVMGPLLLLFEKLLTVFSLLTGAKGIAGVTSAIAGSSGLTATLSAVGGVLSGPVGIIALFAALAVGGYKLGGAIAKVGDEERELLPHQQKAREATEQLQLARKNLKIATSNQWAAEMNIKKLTPEVTRLRKEYTEALKKHGRDSQITKNKEIELLDAEHRLKGWTDKLKRAEDRLTSARKNLKKGTNKLKNAEKDRISFMKDEIKFLKQIQNRSTIAAEALFNLANVQGGAHASIQAQISGAQKDIKRAKNPKKYKKGSFGEMISNVGKKNQRQSGGYIEKEGLYHLHANEKVVPSGAFAGPTGEGVTINVYGNVNAGSQEQVENFGRTVARQFKLNQMGAS